MKKAKNGKIDLPVLLITLALLVYGFMVLFSASTVQSYKDHGTITYYIIHQAVYGGLVGAVALYICSRLDYHIWLKLLPGLIIVSLVSLVLVKMPGMGYSAGGAVRWLDLGFISVQPGEFAKLVIILYLAAWADRKKHAMNDFYFGVLPSLLIIGLFAAFILWQPDLGTMIVLIVTSMVMLFVGGINLRYFFWTIVTGVLALAAFIKFEPYRARRITTFLNPAIDPKGISYQINQALLAIGSGGLWGYGYGLSRQKYNYLPETTTDSIFAIMAEELGFFRVTILILLFVAFVLRGIKIAKNAPDGFGKMIAVGIVAYIGFQAVINIGAMVNLLPLTGIPLPFFSYGSTALIASMAGVGILLNISRQSNL